MYRQILVHEGDADWQRMVWRWNATQPVRDYRLLTVTYGTASAPYLALRVIQQLAQDGQEQFPEASSILLRQVYVDDAFAGGDTVESAIERRNQLIKLLASACLPLGRWAANTPQLLKDLDAVEPSEIGVRLDDVISTLGLKWHPRSDHLLFKVEPIVRKDKITKRSILSEVAKLFDPLGWLAPTLVAAKIPLQDLWIAGSDWNQPVPSDILVRWNKFQDDLPGLANVRVARWLGGSEKDQWQLHGFADASTRAYAAAIYVVFPGVSSHLLVAKSKVAPVKIQILPRLELCGALLLTRLAGHIPQMPTCPQLTQFWTDSRVVLEWLNSHPSRWQTFVANRVSEISASFPGASWRHVRSALNPADCATRGVLSAQLIESKLWWHDPDWLVKSSSEWPGHSLTNIDKVTPSMLAGVEEITIIASSIQAVNESHLVTQFEKLSSYAKIVRILAYCGRWMLNCQAHQATNGDSLRHTDS